MSVRVFETEERLAYSGAGWIASLAAQAIAERGRFDLALPGGRSPAGLLRELRHPYRIPAGRWARIHLWFADERAVPADDPESNAGAVLAALGEVAGLAADNVHRMPADSPDLEAAAREYEAALPPVLDLLVLGIGEDGHVASLFPGSPLLDERAWRVAPVFDSPKPPPRRLTLTPRGLKHARKIVVIALGEEKADAAARALEGPVTPREVPAALLRKREWWLDRAAAAGLRDRAAPAARRG